MATTNAALELLNSTLETLQSSLDGRTAEITKQYNEAKKLADKAHKEALRLAEKSKKEAELEFQSEKNEIGKLKNAIKALTGEPIAKTKATGNSKLIEAPASYEASKSWNEKLVFIVNQIGEGTNDDIFNEITKIDKGFDIEKSGKTVNLTLSKLKGMGAISTSGKKGKKDLYVPAV
jgi:hypothetical protein